MLTSELLSQAKETMLRRGWCQHAYEDPHGVCIEGAINFVCYADATHDGNNAMAAYRILNRLIGQSCISTWNDDPARTPEEVLMVFDAAIAIAQQQEQEIETAVPAGAVAD